MLFLRIATNSRENVGGVATKIVRDSERRTLRDHAATGERSLDPRQRSRLH